jgi:hypothetical protein
MFPRQPPTKLKSHQTQNVFLEVPLFLSASSAALQILTTIQTYSSYKNLSPRTRLFFGVGLMAWAGIGMTASPQVESALGMVPTEQEKEELDRKLNVRVVRVDKE